jgi:hypothetical protein
MSEKTDYEKLVDKYNATNKQLMDLKLQIDDVKSKEVLPKLEKEYQDKYFKLVANGWVKYIHITKVNSLYELTGDVIQLVTSESGPLTNSTVMVGNANIAIEELDITKNEGIGIVITEASADDYNNHVLDAAKKLVGA